MRSSSGPEPVGESDEVALVDCVEHQDGCTLDDLVFQGGDRQWSLLSASATFPVLVSDGAFDAVALP